MNLKFTKHAKRRIYERLIKISEIEETIASPSYCENIFINKFLARKSFRKKTLEIIYTKESNKILVITAYYL